MTLVIFLGVLLGLIALGMPIAFALLLGSVALMLHEGLFDGQIIAQNLINGADSFSLLAVPFFLLAGELMNAGGLSRRIVSFALALIGHVRGGLGFVAIMAACMMAALSGSAVADAAALSALLVPMMVGAGHSQARSAGLVSAAGIIGPVIPPSIAFVVLGVSANLSISRLFMSGIVPGLLMGCALAATWWFVSRTDQSKTPARQTGRETWMAARQAAWAMGLPVIIVVGLRAGVFTPTEAAVVAAVYALFVSVVIYRELSFYETYRVFLAAARTTGVVMFLVAASLVSAWMITIADLPSRVILLLEPLVASPALLMAAIMLLVFLIGTTMDMIPTILIMVPVLMPLVREAGIDPIYFGVLFVINASIGLITPPVGTVLNVVAGITQTRVAALIVGIWPFLLAQLFVLALLLLFPSIVTVPGRWFSGH